MNIDKARSFLFVPGHRLERFSKAAASGAHAIIIDLEDAVGPDEKDVARGHASEWLASGGSALVRINATDTPHFEHDITALRSSSVACLMLPKAEPVAAAALAAALPNIKIVALVETVAGLLSLPDLVQNRAVKRIAFGNLDFGADAKMPGTGGVLDYARFMIALHSRSARLPQPIDGVSISFDNEGALKADVYRARELGFGGKLCIHPRQVGVVNTSFAPTSDEVAWAHEVTAALEASAGAAVQLNGKMVDKPMIEQAAAILAEADA